MSRKVDECQPLPPTPSTAPSFFMMLLPGVSGLHVPASQLDVSTFCWIRWVHDFPPVY